MEKHEEKQYINVVAIIGMVFIIGVLLGNIIVSRIQEKEFSIEPTTQEESVVYLKKPQPVKNFLYEDKVHTDTIKDNDSLETTKPNVENEKTTYSHKENIDKPTTETKETEKSEEVESETTEVKSTTEVSDETTETDKTTETSTDIPDETTEEETIKSKPIINADSYRCSSDDIYYVSPVRKYTEEQKELIAKMLFCEANTTSWDCQVATCSAIINHIEHFGGDFSVLDIKNHFEPAPYYRYKTPTETNWKVLDYVLNGHLIADVKYFQLYNYHSFGTPMFKINGVYFSK